VHNCPSSNLNSAEISPVLNSPDRVWQV